MPAYCTMCPTVLLPPTNNGPNKLTCSAACKKRYRAQTRRNSRKRAKLEKSLHMNDMEQGLILDHQVASGAKSTTNLTDVFQTKMLFALKHVNNMATDEVFRHPELLPHRVAIQSGMKEDVDVTDIEAVTKAVSMDNLTPLIKMAWDDIQQLDIPYLSYQNVILQRAIYFQEMKRDMDQIRFVEFDIDTMACTVAVNGDTVIFDTNTFGPVVIKFLLTKEDFDKYYGWLEPSEVICFRSKINRYKNLLRKGYSNMYGEMEQEKITQIVEVGTVKFLEAQLNQFKF